MKYEIIKIFITLIFEISNVTFVKCIVLERSFSWRSINHRTTAEPSKLPCSDTIRR